MRLIYRCGHWHCHHAAVVYRVGITSLLIGSHCHEGLYNPTSAILATPLGPESRRGAGKFSGGSGDKNAFSALHED